MTVYDRIEDLLDERKWSRRKLAIEAGIKPNTLNAILTRRSENGVSSENLIALADALEVDPGYLLGKTNSPDEFHTSTVKSDRKAISEARLNRMMEEIAEVMGLPSIQFSTAKKLAQAYEDGNESGEYAFIVAYAQLLRQFRYAHTDVQGIVDDVFAEEKKKQGHGIFDGVSSGDPSK